MQAVSDLKLFSLSISSTQHNHELLLEPIVTNIETQFTSVTPGATSSTPWKMMYQDERWDLQESDVFDGFLEGYQYTSSTRPMKDDIKHE